MRHPVLVSSPEALRRILTRSAVALNLLTVVLLAVPLSAAIWVTNRASAVASLEREATRALALSAQTDLRSFPAALDPGTVLGMYDDTGTRGPGSGPEHDDDARGALGDGVIRVVSEGGLLVVYVPFPSESGHSVTIRAASPWGPVIRRTFVAWLGLGVLGATSLGISALVAARRSRELAKPFERLARAADDLRQGGFVLSIPDTGVREGNQVARALESAARSAADRVEVAHSLAEDAGHQVRTPIAAAGLALESALAVPGSDLASAASTALVQLDRANDALSEVMALRRLPLAELAAAPAAETLTESVIRWQPILATQGRALSGSFADLPAEASAAEAVVRQVLDVLLDNSVQHGEGSVTLSARQRASWLLVDVADQGTVAVPAARLFTRGEGQRTGIGLALARALAESVGGSLVLAEAEGTRFTLALPIPEQP
jgi:signal transduction histidine kinase